MKHKGQSILPPSPELIVIPRVGATDIILYASAVLSFEEFKAGNPEPKPPTITRRGEQPQPDLDDADYKKEMRRWGELKYNWTCFKSLRLANPDLEFETIKDDDANTWGNFEEEMLKSFTQGELNHIVGKIMEANGLSQVRLKEARDRFLNPAPGAPSK